jgi:ABC-2 type transport system ATP-binding protein
VRILATLARADAGTARVAGFDVVADRAAVRRKISLTGQYTAVDDAQTGEENLRMMGRLAGLTCAQARQRSRALLGRLDLADAGGRKAGTYSGGMRRRLDLAASLMGYPEVIFLDEPSTGLDLRSRQAMWQVISGLAQSGVTIFLTTQYLEEADQLASRVSVLDGGKIVADGTPRALKQRVGGQRLDIVLASPAAFDDAARLLGRRVVHHDRAGLTLGVATDGTAGHQRALLDEIDPGRSAVQSFAVHATSLDDVFLALTRHSASPACTPSGRTPMSDLALAGSATRRAIRASSRAAVMTGRALRLSRRNIDAVVTAIVAVSWLSAAIGLLAGSPDAANGATFVVLFLPYASSGFVPISTMPTWLRGFARHQPATPVIDSVRAHLMVTPAGTSTWPALAWCGGILAASAAASALIFQHRTARG